MAPESSPPGSLNSGPAAAGGELKVWDAKSGTLLLDLTQPVSIGVNGERGGSVAFSPDGTRIVTGGVRHKNNSGGEVKVWDAKTGQVLVRVNLSPDVVLGVAFSRDGTRIATANHNKIATVRDAATGTALVELKGHRGSVNSVAFSPDGTQVVTAATTTRSADARPGRYS